jgi:hypothetical protein
MPTSAIQRVKRKREKEGGREGGWEDIKLNYDKKL